MKKLLCNYSRLFQVDTDNDTVKSVERDVSRIDSMYMIDEDQTLCVQDGDGVVKKDVHPGDIVIIFYDDHFPNKTIIVHSDEWVENIKEDRAAEQKRKEEWAAKQNKDSQPTSVVA